MNNKRYSVDIAKSIINGNGTKPEVSVIVPMYNTAYTLSEALDSIRKQSLSNIEIVCVDDGSTDETLDIVKNCPDSRITLVSHDQNYGCGAAMNDGIEVASGRWIAILEPDDYILPGMLERLVSTAMIYEETGTKIDIVKSPYYRLIRPEGVRRGDQPEQRRECSYRHRVKTGIPFDMSDNNAVHLLRHHPSIWSAIYSKNFLEQYDISFVEYPGSGWADNEFFYKTLLQAEHIVYVDEPFYCYREETDEEFNAAVIKNPQMPFDRWQSMQDIIENLDCCQGVRASHISRGFTYLDGITRANGINHPVVCEQREHMFDRMDAELVAAEPQLRPDMKALYFNYTGKPWNGTQAKTMYARELIKATAYTARNNGAKFTIDMIKDYLKKVVRKR